MKITTSADLIQFLHTAELCADILELLDLECLRL